MPFLQLHFSTANSTTAFHENVGRNIELLNFPLRPLNAILDADQSEWANLPIWRKALNVFHIFLLCFLIVFMVLMLTVEFYSIVFDYGSGTLSYIVFGTFMLKIRGIISFFFSIIWNLKRRSEEFNSILNETSGGVGFLRRAKQIRIANYISILYNLCGVVLLIAVTLIRKLRSHPDVNSDLSLVLSWPMISMNIVGCICLGFSHLFASSLILTNTGILIAEFRSLADEFRSDSNTFQLPVVGHYFHAHQNVLRLYNCLQHYFRFWVNIQLCFSFAQFFYLLSIMDIFSSVVDNLLQLVLLFETMVTIVEISVGLSVLDSTFCSLSNVAINLCVSGKMLTEGTYGLISNFAHYVRRRPTRIRLICGLFAVDYKNVFRISLSLLLLAVWNRLQSDRIVLTFESNK